jgi:NNP family nitrate/nitrite transporter-like MFS transporter
VYAIVPLVKKRVGGQIAGMAGAYGNVGAVSFLTIGLFVDNRTFFLYIAAAAVVAAIVSLLMVEPAESFATVLHTDGVPESIPATTTPVVAVAAVAKMELETATT